jgi:hypothetical protein
MNKGKTRANRVIQCFYVCCFFFKFIITIEGIFHDAEIFHDHEWDGSREEYKTAKAENIPCQIRRFLRFYNIFMI